MQHGWEYLEAMQGIMFSMAARGSHVYRPTQAPPPATTDDTDLGTMATTSAGEAASVTIAGEAASSTIAIAISTGGGEGIAPMVIDEDPSTLLISPVLISSAGKRSHSAMSLSSDESSPPKSGSLSVTTPAPSNPIPKKQQKGSHASEPNPLGLRASQGSRGSRDA
jgi:hypothetical protein